jgi:hypothetical protein
MAAAEKRADRNMRLKREGRWEEYKRTRSELQKAVPKIPIREITRRLKDQFAPGTAKTDVELTNQSLKERYLELLPLIPADRKVGQAEIVSWVASVMDRPKEQGLPLPADIPSRPALSMLLWCLDSQVNRADFWTKLFPRAAGADEQKGRFNDDGRAIIELIEKVRTIRIESIRRASAEGAPGEPQLSASPN